jgi:hypothetical protein
MLGWEPVNLSAENVVIWFIRKTALSPARSWDRDNRPAVVVDEGSSSVGDRQVQKFCRGGSNRPKLAK